MTARRLIGFDRRIRLEWLDAVAVRSTTGATPAELSKFGHRLLHREYPRPETRKRTLTVLFHVWLRVPAKAAHLRETATHLFADASPPHRLAIHWGLSAATYPFFRDLADCMGRLLALQNDAALSQIQRRMAERWGDRSTARRAVRRIIRSWVDWGVLNDSTRPGVYTARHPLMIDGPLACWMVEAMLIGSDRPLEAVSKLKRHPVLFPFELLTSVHDLRRSPALSIHRDDFHESIVEWSQSVAKAWVTSAASSTMAMATNKRTASDEAESF
jgi:hypothetical protein